MKNALSVVVIILFTLLLISKNVYAAAEIDPGTSGGITQEQKFNLLRSIGSMLGLGGEDVDITNPPSPQSIPDLNTIEPTNNPNSPQVNQSFLALDQLWEYVGNKVGVPPCLLDAISYIEYSTVNSYSPEQIRLYQQPGQVIPNCPWNYCSAAGHMQMTMGVDERGDRNCTRCGHGYCPNAWASRNQGQAVLRYEGGNFTPNVCNLRDSTFAAAQKLKNDSGTAQGDMNWSYEKMVYVGGRYYGSSTQRHARLQNRTYGEFIADNCRL